MMRNTNFESHLWWNVIPPQQKRKNSIPFMVDLCSKKWTQLLCFVNKKFVEICFLFCFRSTNLILPVVPWNLQYLLSRPLQKKSGDLWIKGYIYLAPSYLTIVDYSLLKILADFPPFSNKSASTIKTKCILKKNS